MSNYLHELIGAFDNAKRREVRKLFNTSTPATILPEDEAVCEDNIGLAVGIISEFKQIGVSQFTIGQAVSVVEIFGLQAKFGDRDIGAELNGLFSGHKIRLYSTSAGSPVTLPGSGQNRQSTDKIYSVPDDARLAHLVQQFCPASKKEAI